MSEEQDNLDEAPTEPKAEPITLNEALIEGTMARLTARGERSRIMACMGLPTPLFNDLVRRLLDRTAQIHSTAEWLEGECGVRAGGAIDTPSRSSVYRFAAVVREEFELARIASSRQSSASIVAALTEGDPEARVMALNNHYIERLTDKLLDLETLDPKQMMAVSDALRTVLQGTFGSKVANARVDGMRKQIEERDGRIGLIAAELKIKDQKLAELPAKVKALAEKIDAVETAQSAGKKIDPAIFAAIRAQLTEMTTGAGEGTGTTDAGGGK